MLGFFLFFSCTLSSKDYEPCDAGEVFCLVFGVLCCQRTLNLVIMEKLSGILSSKNFKPCDDAKRSVWDQ